MIQTNGFFIMCLVIFHSCTTNSREQATAQPSSIPYANYQKFETQGHRGCRGLMPENTIPAMLHALDLGVTTLELDVVFTADKQILVSHETYFNHETTTKPDGSYVTEKEERNFNIYHLKYDEVLKYDVGLKPHPRFPEQQKMKAVKPLLTALFDSVGLYMKKANRPYPYFNIETKCLPIEDNIYNPAPPEFVDLLMHLIKEKQLEEYVMIQSFDMRTLKYLHEHYPNIPTSLLIEEEDKIPLKAQFKKLGFVPNVCSPHYRFVDTTLLTQCHQLQVRVIPWTVNEKPEIDRLKALGVDGIISDYPNLFFEH